MFDFEPLRCSTPIDVVERNRHDIERSRAEEAERLDREMAELMASLSDDDEPPTEPSTPVQEKNQESAKSSEPPEPPSAPTPPAVSRKHAHEPADYFPVPPIGATVSSVNLMNQLEEVCLRIDDDRNYDTHRDEFCALSLQLNLQGKIAPAFRPRPQLRGKPTDPDRTTFQRDLITIDCHWLHARGTSIMAADAKYQRMLDSKRPFNFDEAWTFACQGWRNAHRATNVLSLATVQQCQLATLRGEQVADRAAHAQGGRLSTGKKVMGKFKAICQRINDWCARDPRITALFHDYVNLWLARELLGTSATMAQIADLHALILGRGPLSSKTISDKLKRLDRELAGM